MDHLQITCSFCQNDYVAIKPNCPHCENQGPFPNVLLALGEEAILLERYHQATARAQTKGVVGLFDQAQSLVENQGRVCFNRNYLDIIFLLEKDGSYVSFYKSIDAGMRFPENNDWDRKREAVDSLFFPYFKDNICFAALALDDGGVHYYGPCCIVLNTAMVGHRATLFEENTILFCEKHQVRVTGDIPKGYRATWAQRGVLAATKVEADLTVSTTIADLPALLVRQDPQKNGDDVFLEVHIFGSFTLKSIALVTFPGKPPEEEELEAKLLERSLKRKGVSCSARL